MPKRNDNKTELMLVTSKRTKHLHSLPTSITISNAQISFKQFLKNLDLTLDCKLTMNAHFSKITRTCYFELRRLASIRRFLTSTAVATIVSAVSSYLVSSILYLVVSSCLVMIDYSNSLLFGSTHDVTSRVLRTHTYAY